jgi:hypothetical protein
MHRFISPIFSLSLFFLSFLYVNANTNEQGMIDSVFQIRTYDVEPMTGDYEYIKWGSAVLLDEKRIITNAHVILDIDKKSPT